jgi:hypothetical protein
MTAPSYRLNVISVFLSSVFLIVLLSMSVSAQVPGVQLGGGQYATPPSSSTPAAPKSGSNIDKNFGVSEKTASACRAIRSRILAEKTKTGDKKKYETCAWQLIGYCEGISSASKGSVQANDCYHQLFGVSKCTSDRGASAGCVSAANVICMKQISPSLISVCLKSTGVGPSTAAPVDPAAPGGGDAGGGDAGGDTAAEEPAGPTDEGEKAEHPLTKQHSVCDKGEGSENDGQLTNSIIKDGEHKGESELGCARKLEKDKCAEAAFGPLKDLTCNDPDGGLEGNSIVKMLKLAVKVIAVGVGIIITGVLATAGIQYAAARGNPQAISGAKNKILAALGGLAIYLLFAALVNFLIPGGIIG